MQVSQHDVRQVSALSTGERIRSARRARGMSRPVLAGLVGRSPDWLKKIETGVRPLNSLPLLVQLARVLGLDDVSELTGDDYSAPVHAWQGEIHHVVPAIRRALTEASFEMPGDGATSVSSADELTARVRALWLVWHRSARQRSEVGPMLPALIRAAHASVRATGGVQRRRCRSATGDLYRLVQRLLAHICEPELHALAVERGRAFSEEADTPRALAEAAWASAVGLCAAGYHDDAAAVADHGVATLTRSYRAEPAESAWGTLGALQLEAAAAHGLAGRDGDAYRYLDAAAGTAGRMPHQAWHLPSAFDRSNVEIMAVIVGTSLRRPGEAISRANRIDLTGMRSVVRRSRLLLECADAHAQRREYTDAVRRLDAAVRVSAEAIALIPWARPLADELAANAPHPARRTAEQVAATMQTVC